jgi:hypothetical protein
MAKRKVETQTNSLTPDHEMSGIDLIFVRAGGVRHTVGELLMRTTTLLRPHPDQRSEHKVIAPQSCGSSNLGSFKTPLWESQDKKPFGCSPRGKVQNILYGGRWWLPPGPGCG